jgi:hypothetical protein
MVLNSQYLIILWNLRIKKKLVMLKSNIATQITNLINK